MFTGKKVHITSCWISYFPPLVLYKYPIVGYFHYDDVKWDRLENIQPRDNLGNGGNAPQCLDRGEDDDEQPKRTAFPPLSKAFAPPGTGRSSMGGRHEYPTIPAPVPVLKQEATAKESSGAVCKIPALAEPTQSYGSYTALTTKDDGTDEEEDDDEQWGV
ncbi:uncharacterized protein FIESC28_00885 [Fusarium coffeatum]|uniref:Uncharacterized protein n=1 Tax=Fusarium coffeatum TaxID=231269 RepID=A0A366SBY3_9HYPO|nr:uncharacterized protein FIESC28_00885 [Fusarium coffeatum]RBR26240.1 hypothetical protein FIESC28_00885 [Fusarium coffeatum]